MEEHEVWFNSSFSPWFVSLLFLQDNTFLSHTLSISFEVAGNSMTEYLCICNKKARKYPEIVCCFGFFFRSFCVLCTCLYQCSNKSGAAVPQGNRKMFLGCWNTAITSLQRWKIPENEEYFSIQLLLDYYLQLYFCHQKGIFAILYSNQNLYSNLCGRQKLVTN